MQFPVKDLLEGPVSGVAGELSIFEDDLGSLGHPDGGCGGVLLGEAVIPGKKDCFLPFYD